MSEENDQKWFLKASRKRAELAERETTLDRLADAIGERRERDFLDIVATLEQDEDWSTALQYIMDAADREYPVPASFGKARTRIEPLKYREMIFALLSCNGLEPVEPTTASLLQMLESNFSLADASQSLLNHVHELAMNQIESGDTFFFDLSNHTSLKFRELAKLLESVRMKQITGSVLTQENDQVDITPLWFSEYGRVALSEIGVKGQTASRDQIDLVLSVIQVSPTIKRSITILEQSEIPKTDYVGPSNKTYNSLHEDIIDQNLESLISYGSIQSIPTLSTILDTTVSNYISSESSEDYRQMLQCINCHVAVRNLNSILVLERLLETGNHRIITPAIMALGNFYHESSALAIAELLCSQKDEPITKVAVHALENIMKKCPEVIPAIKRMLDSDCKNKKPLRQLLSRSS
ncbi:MAG: hypothetical protein ACFFD6_03090 [Candidatus Thorarchaeota archaeon]